MKQYQDDEVGEDWVNTACSRVVAATNRHHLSLYLIIKHIMRDTRWRIWLRYCATSRKVAGSIPDGVIGIFH
jgi:hypothetical protein